MSHSSITGNEYAYRAKDVLSEARPTCFKVPSTYINFMKIQPFVSSSWQERWDKEMGNKVHAFMLQINERYCSWCTDRKGEANINHLWIGHKRLTHFVRMENRPLTPICNQCVENNETIKHIVITFNFLRAFRRRNYDVADLKQLFQEQSTHGFMKDGSHYNNL